MKRNESWRNSANLKGLLASLMIGFAAVAIGGTNSPPDEGALCARALTAKGDWARLHLQLDRARRGERIVIGVIGGSITQGATASAPEKCYGNRVAAWWREQFAASKVEFVNAGIGATGSDYGALRAERDLLAQKPNFVIVEYAVNDGNKQICAETLEGLLRQILKQANQPAVLLLFMMHRDGRNAQGWFSKVGSHYGLPMISYRDALWPEIEAGRMQWADISPDEVHPNDRGHGYAARFVTDLLDQALRSLRAVETNRPIPSLPVSLLTDLFEQVRLAEANSLNPLANNGWLHDTRDGCWKSHQPGSTIEFEIEGRAILTMHYVLRGPMGRARVSVDGVTVQELEGWFDQTWGGYRKTRVVARDLAAGSHRVRFELLPDKNAQSTGHEFRILGLGAAGN